MSDVSTKQSNNTKNIVQPIFKPQSVDVTAKPVCTSCARKHSGANFVPYLFDRICTVERCENITAFLYIL